MNKINYTVALVFKQSHEYTIDILLQTIHNIRTYTPYANIVCLTNIELNIPGIKVIPLLHNWEGKGWWSKIELFRPNIFSGPVLYLDIDTRIINDLQIIVDEWAANGKQFTMLKSASFNELTDVGSGVMMWEGDYSHIYNTFVKNSTKYITEYVKTKKWGDQDFIKDNCNCVIGRFSDKCRSYKKHCGTGIPPGTCIIFFHGNPRPWTLNGPWDLFVTKPQTLPVQPKQSNKITHQFKTKKLIESPTPRVAYPVNPKPVRPPLSIRKIKLKSNSQ